MIKEILDNIKSLADPERALHSQKYFKTGKGEYGAGDKFLGLKMPQIRKIASKYKHIDLTDLESLLHNPIHEVRHCSLIILVEQYKKAAIKEERKRIYNLYLENTSYINNWDLVDTSAPHIVGKHLFDQVDKSKLFSLAQSKDLWERRISVLSTLFFIRKNHFDETIELCELLLEDPEDLIHKATGWMLREVGKRNEDILHVFLRKHCRVMPRTMLRYAIEKLENDIRKQYLKGEIPLIVDEVDDEDESEVEDDTDD
ncbi:DNA alkylation repair enzyme like protein [Aduncisulcus paluster]|uniref:DNA alkylation repair enzyme like protein n=1 Tax=Aduncisulcus paluster TaxID=2918883 RepID=A0ABQ5K5B6_9EUKA|nr:DNA alkylation repair enzyme like protein [Aduncisulcus paluster]